MDLSQVQKWCAGLPERIKVITWIKTMCGYNTVWINSQGDIIAEVLLDDGTKEYHRGQIENLTQAELSELVSGSSDWEVMQKHRFEKIEFNPPF